MLLFLAKYGLREILMALGMAASIMALLVFTAPAYLWPAPAVLFIAVAMFFRDPRRIIPANASALLAPADGRIVELTEIVEDRFLNRKSLKIGIFLSVLDVHINRAPCSGTVKTIHYQPGKFRNAMKAESSKENECNYILITHALYKIPILIKQISGAIARRIVCDLAVNDTVEFGQKIGMIKFGSRTELYVPMDRRFQVRIKLNDKVRAGETILGEFE